MKQIKELYTASGYGHLISVNLVIKAPKFRGGRDFRDHLVNSFSLKVKKVRPREHKRLVSGIELVTRKLVCLFSVMLSYNKRPRPPDRFSGCANKALAIELFT